MYALACVEVVICIHMNIRIIRVIREKDLYQTQRQRKRNQLLIIFINKVRGTRECI